MDAAFNASLVVRYIKLNLMKATNFLKALLVTAACLFL